jgi:general secretion pathway protein H
LSGLRRLRATAAGFSLLELMVVLMILAVASFFAVPAVRSGWQAREVRQGTRQLAGLMRSLRENAVRTGRELELVVDPDGQTFRWTGGEAALPPAAWITGVRGGWRDQDGSVRVIFYPNGGATGTGFVVAGREDTGLRFSVDVDALLGTVRIEDVTS